MSVTGKWRIVEMPGYPDDYPDLAEPAYILFENGGGGEFAFGACTGNIWEASSANATSVNRRPKGTPYRRAKGTPLRGEWRLSR